MHASPSFNVLGAWAKKLDAKRTSRRLIRTALPLLIALWAVVLLGLTITDYGWLKPGRRKDGLSVPVKNSALVDKGFLLKGPHVLCPGTVKYRLGTPVNETDGCRCDAGWGGGTCIEPVCSLGCEHGKCTKPGQCKCRSGWKGKKCNEAICNPVCRHGSCIRPNECECDTNWQGPFCSVACLHGSYQDAVFLDSGRPAAPCTCDEGWHGKTCSQAMCTRFGCTNGVCAAPDKCKCDPGWRGSDCADDSLPALGKQLLKGVYLDKAGFDSLVFNQGTGEKAWRHLVGFTEWMADASKSRPDVLRPHVPVNDTLTGFDWRAAATKSSRGKRWNRCAVVGDGAGLLRTQLGAMIDRHDAVLRFNLASTSGSEGHVGEKTTLRVLNRMAAEVLSRRYASSKSSKSKANPVPVTGVHLLWRPDTYEYFPRLRRRAPVLDIQLILSDWVAGQLETYKILLARLVDAGMLDTTTGIGKQHYPEEFIDPTLFLNGQHRVPTTFIGICLMIQMCRKVNIFGFDPPSVQANTRGMGYLSSTYYNSQLLMVAATEAEDEAVVLADQDPSGSLRPNRGTDKAVFVPEGEPYPGAGGTFAGGSLDHLILRLMELGGYVSVCTSDHPEKCLG